MLRHFKQRQQGGLTPRDFNQVKNHLQQLSSQTVTHTGVLLDYTNPVRSQPITSSAQNAISAASNKTDSKQQVPKRIRGKRSSKPMMEKRRRARINECLETLKSYVLHDTINLSQLGIDSAASENQDEETIARTILKSSGLINRHRGRKNPNKLEKADILELTVDYVRRLHEQREQLLAGSRQQATLVDCRLTATTPICIATDLSLNSTMPVPPPTPASLGCDNSTSASSASMSPPQSCLTPSSESCGSTTITRSCGGGGIWADELAAKPVLVRHQMALGVLPYFWSPNSDQRALCSTPADGH